MQCYNNKVNQSGVEEHRFCWGGGESDEIIELILQAPRR